MFFTHNIPLLIHFVFCENFLYTQHKDSEMNEVWSVPWRKPWPPPMGSLSSASSPLSQSQSMTRAWRALDTLPLLMLPVYGSPLGPSSHSPATSNCPLGAAVFSTSGPSLCPPGSPAGLQSPCDLSHWAHCAWSIAGDSVLVIHALTSCRLPGGPGARLVHSFILSTLGAQ